MLIRGDWLVYDECLWPEESSSRGASPLRHGEEGRSGLGRALILAGADLATAGALFARYPPVVGEGEWRHSTRRLHVTSSYRSIVA
jgi:hypothetical protein